MKSNFGRFCETCYCTFVAIVLISIVYISLQFTFLQRTSEFHLTDAIAKGLVSLSVMFCLFIVQRLQNEKKVYILLLTGLTIFYFHAVTDFLNEFFKQPKFLIFIEDSFHITGTILLILGISIWTGKLRKDLINNKEAEEQIRYSEKRYSELYEASRDGIAIADLHGKIVDCNFAFLQMHGYILEELKKLTLWDLMPEKSPKWNKTEIVENQLLKRGYSDLYEKEAVREDRSIFSEEVRLYLIKDKLGNPSGMWVNVRDITERKLTEERIKASLNEKVLLLREIHHRVKNNMQIISSLLLLQSLSIKEEKFVEIFEQCQDRIKSMALIHDKLYQTEELANIDFREYTEDLTHTLFDSYKKDGDKVSLKIDVENIFLDIDTAVPLGLIINELVTNALKHAFKNGKEGELSVSLREIDQEQLELKVCDNGIGLPENIDWKHPENLGLQIVAMLAENQLKGKISLEKSNGTEFYISLKKAKYAKRV